MFMLPTSAPYRVRENLSDGVTRKRIVKAVDARLGEVVSD